MHYLLIIVPTIKWANLFIIYLYIKFMCHLSEPSLQALINNVLFRILAYFIGLLGCIGYECEPSYAFVPSKLVSIY